MYNFFPHGTGRTSPFQFQLNSSYTNFNYSLRRTETEGRTQNTKLFALFTRHFRGPRNCNALRMLNKNSMARFSVQSICFVIKSSACRVLDQLNSSLILIQQITMAFQILRIILVIYCIYAFSPLFLHRHLCIDHLNGIL